MCLDGAEAALKSGDFSSHVAEVQLFHDNGYTNVLGEIIGLALLLCLVTASVALIAFAVFLTFGTAASRFRVLDLVVLCFPLIFP